MRFLGLNFKQYWQPRPQRRSTMCVCHRGGALRRLVLSAAVQSSRFFHFAPPARSHSNSQKIAYCLPSHIKCTLFGGPVVVDLTVTLYLALFAVGSSHCLYCSPIPGILRRRLAGKLHHGLSQAEFAVRRDGKLLLATVGLPARGKTYIAQSIKRHMVRKGPGGRGREKGGATERGRGEGVKPCLFRVWCSWNIIL